MLTRGRGVWSDTSEIPCQDPSASSPTPSCANREERELWTGGDDREEELSSSMGLDLNLKTIISFEINVYMLLKK